MNRKNGARIGLKTELTAFIPPSIKIAPINDSNTSPSSFGHSNGSISL
jgi:hypothetical protein